MSQPTSADSLNPYAPPKQAAHPNSDDAQEVEYRDLIMVVLLSVVTCGIGYPIYLWYQWARELNGLAGRVKYPSTLILVLSILSLGMAGLIYECIFAHDLQQEMKVRGRSDALDNLMIWVTVLNAIAVAASFTVIGVVIALPCGMAATCLVQHEFNKLARV